MLRIALKMLVGDPTKYVGLILGVAFATTLMGQQLGIFFGLLGRSSSVVKDAREADIWVTDPAVETVDAPYPMRDTQLGRVRGVEGVAWAVPFFQSGVEVRTRQGTLERGNILGVDDVSLVGVPNDFVIGSVEDLRRPDAIAINSFGFRLLFPGEELSVGKELELNDRRAVIRAIVNASPSFAGNVILYTRYSLALSYTNNGRNELTFILAKAAPGRDPAAVARRVSETTGMRALTSEQLRTESVWYIIKNTGIPISFGAVVFLGVAVGVAVVGLTFNQFISENMRQYAALKAIGVRNGRLALMTLCQAGFVGVVGFGLGLGIVGAFFHFVAPNVDALKGFYLPWQVALGIAGVALLIVTAATLFGLRRVLFVDPATVFRG